MPLSARTSPRRRRAALVGLGSAVVALVVAEVVLRALALPAAGRSLPSGRNADSVLVADADLFWRLDPDGGRYQVNTQGLRGPWPRSDRHPNELRVVCVGDSCTFGTGVRIDQTYGYRLEDELQDRLPRRRVSTTLLALPGYSTFQDRLLVERHAADLRPDVAILYCGAWNDFAPARGRRDSQRGTEAPLRLARLLDQALDGIVYAGSREDVGEGGERRVAPAEFRDNLRAMIERLQGDDSRVIVVLPPAPADTLRRHPAAESYREIVRELAERDDVAFVDGQSLFESFLESVPPGRREDGAGRSILFRDWIHPAPLGHELLARAILEVLQPELPRWRAAAQQPAAPRLGEPVPRELPHGESTTVEIPVFEPAGIERVWLGERVVARFESEPGRLRLVVPGDLTPGSYPIQVATEGGWFETGRQVTIEAPPIGITIARTDDTAQLTAEVAGPPGADVLLWMALERRPEPVATRYGPFELRFDEGDGPPVRPAPPLRFNELPLPAFRERVGDDGIARFRETFTIDDGRQPDAGYFQALVREGGTRSGFLTCVVRTPVPR